MFTKAIKTALVIASVSVAMTANASLTIINNTKFDSTSIIEDGMCSKDLPGGIGVTHPGGKPNEISDFFIGLACWTNRTHCKADVYMNDSCTGPHIATVYFDSTKGTFETQMLPEGEGYEIIAGNYTVTLNGGPQLN